MMPCQTITVTCCGRAIASASSPEPSQKEEDQMTEQLAVPASLTGRVRAGSRPIRGVLVEAFDAPDGFQRSLPIQKRLDLANHQLRRLGSAITDGSGEFAISYEVGVPENRWFGSAPDTNLWVIASACCQAGQTLEIVYEAGDVRNRAGRSEQYVICLSKDYTDANNEIAASSTAPSPKTVINDFAEREALAEAQLEVSRRRFKKRTETRAAFQTDIAPRLRRDLSLVELDDQDEPIDPDFVKPDESVRVKAEGQMVAAMALNLDANLPVERKLALKGRISLTEAQRNDLEPAAISSDADTITVDEDALTSVLNGEDGHGENPENGSQIVNRVSAIELFCRDKTRGDHCLGDDRGEEGGPIVNGNGPANGDNSNEPEPRIEESQPGDRRDRGGQSVTLDSLKGELPRYIASILDEASVLDTGTSGLPAPGAQLTEESISAATSFPSLTLPPGPADVPAFYDFNDLQIAFKPVWQEALDESVIADAEAVYEHYVDNGGDPGVFWDALVSRVNLSNLVITPTPPDVVVQKHIDITNREWYALNQTQKQQLSDIALAIDELFTFILTAEKLQDNTFTDGLTSLDLTTFTNTHTYVTTKVNDLREQGERIVGVARDELERQAAGQSIVPSNVVLQRLQQRALSAYPAKYFAANKRQRSVNFGLMVTYRQKWIPTAYQVGELIKSIPLAPKEVRKYSRKTVRKERRAQKEIESNLESLRSETNSTTRAEADIVQKAMDKTNFNASANGTFTLGVWSGGGSSGLSEDTEDHSSETKKTFHESVVKAAQEYKNELKVEVETESTFESEFQESGELMNPNDTVTVNYLFYELQRRYRVEERLHRLTSVVLVAQEMPNPAQITEDWLIANRWILNRVLLDDAFKQPLHYVADGLVAEQHALEEMRKSLLQQRRLVEELKEDVSDSRVLTESRYSALQRSMERSARATQRKSKGGGLFGFAKKLVAPSAIEGIVDSFVGDQGGETPEVARIREAAAQDAYQRELQRLRDMEGQLAQSNASLSRATEEYTDRLSAHLSNVLQITELKNHIKDNVTHYMQAIWMHEPFQQRWLRLKDVPVPVLKRPDAAKRTYVIGKKAITGSLANVAHLGTAIYDFTTFPDLEVPDGTQVPELETVPLYQVADIDGLLGFRANYMIFPMRKGNAITDFMMEPYVEKAAGALGITDPDDFGNMSLDEFSDYVCCLKRELSEDEFAKLVDTLKAQLKKLLQSPLRDDEEIVVPMDATYIEALPGATPILENFKLLHRQIDAADAQEDLRLKKMEKIRYAHRLLAGRLDDPEADARYEFTGNPDMDFAINQPPPGEGGGS